jgi:adenylate cyclase
MLNGLLTHTFYRKWSFWNALGAICLFSLPLGIAAMRQKPWMLYAAGGLVLAGTVGLTWVQFLHFSLVPACTIGGSLLAIWAGFVMELQISISKQQAFIRGAFSKYVPEEVVRELLLHPERLQLGGEERQLSVLFSDIEGFTTIAESMSPSELVTLLNAYLSAMTTIVLAQGGIIDKFEGDAIMAEFGAPLARPDHADMAVQTGLAMQRHLHELRQVWARQGWPVIRCRVGISTGTMLLGNMGSDQVFDYTVIGDTVNLASRLEEANKRYQTSIIISESTYHHLSPERFRTRFLDIVQVKGKSQVVKVFEVYGTRDDDVSPESTAYYAAYETAFHAYLSRHFMDAKAHFDRALAWRPNDPAALAMLHRISELEPDHLPDDWDGSIALTTK